MPAALPGELPLAKKGDSQPFYCFLCFPDGYHGQKGPAYSTFNWKPASGNSPPRAHVTKEHAETATELLSFIAAEAEKKKPISYFNQKAGAKKGSTQSALPFVSSELYPAAHPKQVQFQRDAVMWLCKQNLPLSTTKAPYFRQMVANLDPRIRPLEPTTISRKILPDMFNAAQQIVETKLQRCLAVSLQVDIWMHSKVTDVVGLEVIGINQDTWELVSVSLGCFECSGTTGQDLARLLSQKLGSLASKVVAHTRDGGRNLHAMIRILSENANGPLGSVVYSVDCFSHLLNAGCKKAVAGPHGDAERRRKVNEREAKKRAGQVEAQAPKRLRPTNNLVAEKYQACLIDLAALRKRVAAIGSWPRKSPSAKKLWRDACSKYGTSKKAITQMVPTRWGTECQALSDVVEKKDVIHAVYGFNEDAELRSRDLSLAEFATCEAVQQALAPVLELLKKSQGKWMLGEGVANMLRLVEILDRHNIDDQYILPDPAQEQLRLLRCFMRDSVLAELEPVTSWATSHSSSGCHYFLSQFLDIRYKGCAALAALNGREKALALIKDYKEINVLNLMATVRRKLEPTQEEVEPVDADLDDVGCLPTDSVSSTDELQNELNRYCTVKQIADADPLLWWKTNQQSYPRLSYLALVFLCIPASQADVERIFSVAGILTALRRSSLSVEKLNMMIYLQKNYQTPSTPLGQLEDEENPMKRLKREFPGWKQAMKKNYGKDAMAELGYDLF